MGMASTQVRLLQLTNRKNDIGLQLSKLSNDKMSLTRDMQRISKDYQNALNQKVLKWSNNSGVSYTNLSYQNLMSPSVINLNKPYLITNQNGRVVVDNKYKKYAEMISPDGSPVGNWDAVKADIIADLTGINSNDVQVFTTSQEQILTQQDALNQIKAKEPVMPTKTESFSEFLGKMNGVIGNGWLHDSNGEAYYNGYHNGMTSNNVDWSTFNDKLTFGTADNWDSLLDDMYETLVPYTADPENFKKAFNDLRTIGDKIIDNPIKDSDTMLISYWGDDPKKYLYLNSEMFFAQLFASYSANSSNVLLDESKIECVDSDKYESWKTEHDAWQALYDNTYANYETALSVNNQIFTAEEEALINFYDAMFSAIAEKGWNYNSQVSDEDYLKQCLQRMLNCRKCTHKCRLFYFSSLF